MKTQVLQIAVLVMALFGVSGATAQGQPGDVLVNIPFSFIVGNHQLPAGRYRVTSAAHGFLRMFDTQDAHNQLSMPVNSVQSPVPQTAKLVFHRYGNAYFLAEVWNDNGNIGRQLPKSTGELEVASGRAQGTSARGEIALVRPER
jgi:hypothetical protein